MNSAAGLTPQEFADELFATKNLSAPTYQRLHRELDENQFLEFCMLVCHYVMAAMMLDVAGCEVEPAFRRLPVAAAPPAH
jgi:hypothetical protein